jgi:hypothetical protein
MSQPQAGEAGRFILRAARNDTFRYSLIPPSASAGLVPVGRRLTGYFGAAPKPLPHGYLPSAARRPVQEDDHEIALATN